MTGESVLAHGPYHTAVAIPALKPVVQLLFSPHILSIFQNICEVSDTRYCYNLSIKYRFPSCSHLFPISLGSLCSNLGWVKSFTPANSNSLSFGLLVLFVKERKSGSIYIQLCWVTGFCWICVSTSMHVYCACPCAVEYYNVKIPMCFTGGKNHNSW